MVHKNNRTCTVYIIIWIEHQCPSIYFISIADLRLFINKENKMVIEILWYAKESWCI